MVQTTSTGTSVHAWREDISKRKARADSRAYSVISSLPELPEVSMTIPTLSAALAESITTGNAYSDLPDKAKHQVGALGDMLAKLRIGNPQFSIAAVEGAQGFSHTPVDKDPTVNQAAAG